MAIALYFSGKILRQLIMKEKPLIKHIGQLNEFVAGDKCFLREVFHPDRDAVKTGFSLAYAYVKPGGRTLDHYLEQSETYYIISGKGMMYLDDGAFEVESGHSYYVPAFCRQWIKNVGTDKLEFLVIVDPPWDKEQEHIAEDQS